jgi:hypothetical protein
MASARTEHDSLRTDGADSPTRFHWRQSPWKHHFAYFFFHVHLCLGLWEAGHEQQQLGQIQSNGFWRRHLTVTDCQWLHFVRTRSKSGETGAGENVGRVHWDLSSRWALTDQLTAGYVRKKRSPTRNYGGAGQNRRYSSYSFMASALDGGEWSASRPRRALPPRKGSPLPIVQEAGWASEPVWTQRLEERSFAYAWDRTPRKNNGCGFWNAVFCLGH